MQRVDQELPLVLTALQLVLAGLEPLIDKG
jgi:hypothetical protein